MGYPCRRAIAISQAPSVECIFRSIAWTRRWYSPSMSACYEFLQKIACRSASPHADTMDAYINTPRSYSRHTADISQPTDSNIRAGTNQPRLEVPTLCVHLYAPCYFMTEGLDWKTLYKFMPKIRMPSFGQLLTCNLPSKTISFRAGT